MFAAESISLFERHASGDLRLIAPFAIYYEVPASILKAVPSGRLDASRGHEAIELFAAIPLPVAGGQRREAASLALHAFRLAARTGCSYYDAIFLALAERLRTQLVTADDRIFRALSGRTDNLLWIEETAT